MHPSLPRPRIKTVNGDRDREGVEGRKLKLLDVCSGTGCISLLLHSLLSRAFHPLSISGLDISPTAIKLSNFNLESNVQNGHLGKIAATQISFLLHDVFTSLGEEEKGTEVDIIISNPPYISARSFEVETSRSVRNFEPKLALVPTFTNTSTSQFTETEREREFGVICALEDVFYRRLIELHKTLRSKVLLMEVGDAEQAFRVLDLVGKVLGVSQRGSRYRFEIWRDWPEIEEGGEEERVQEVVIQGFKVPVKGQGKMRSVVVFSDDV